MSNFVNLILIVINLNFSRLTMDLWLHLAHARKNIKPEIQDNFNININYIFPILKLCSQNFWNNNKKHRTENFQLVFIVWINTALA